MAETKVIPKIIHHVWPGTDTFRAPFPDLRGSWIAHHPDWSHMLWRLGMPGTDEPTGEPYLDRILHDPAYHAIFKSDVLRFWALWKFGGIYADTDMEALRPNDYLVANEGRFLCAYEPSSVYVRSPRSVIASCWLACPPKHPLARHLFESGCIAALRLGPVACNIAGNPQNGVCPQAITSVIRIRQDAFILPTEKLFPEELPENLGVLFQVREKMPPDLFLGECFAMHHWNSTSGSFSGYKKMLETSQHVSPPRPTPPPTNVARKPVALRRNLYGGRG